MTLKAAKLPMETTKNQSSTTTRSNQLVHLETKYLLIEIDRDRWLF